MSNPNWTAPPAVPDAPPNKPSRGLSAEAKERLQKFGSRVGDFDDPPSCPHGVMAGACPACLAIPDAPPMHGDDKTLCERLQKDATGWGLVLDQTTSAATTAALEREAAARIKHLSAECRFLHNRRGQLVIERDRYAAALGEYPDGRDIILAGTLAALKAAESLAEQQKERIAELESERMDILNGAGKIVGTITDAAAERIAELEKDAARYRFVLPMASGEDDPEADRRTLLIGDQLMKGLTGDAAIDAALAADREGGTK